MTADLLPPNASPEERGLALSIARLGDVPVRVREMWDPATCPASHLPWLAWAFSVDEWDSAWTDTQKRAVIEASYNVHLHKGTVGAVRSALAALGYDTEMSEWFQWSPEGEPYTFGVMGELDDRGLSVSMFDEIERTALATKNVRSHLAWIRLRATVRGAFYVGGTTLSAETVEVQPYSLTELESQGPVYVGAALIVYETVEILPLGLPVLALIDGEPLSLTDGAPLRLLH